MKRTTTAIDYSARLERVAAHMNQHLDETLSLERLAEVACFSPFHFHRIFRTLTGETTDQAVRRLRLHRAAVDLSKAEMPIARIASRAGYGSTEAFSRAFSTAYGCAPSEYRAANTAPPVSPGLGEVSANHEVTIEDVAAIRVAGIAHRGDYQQIGAAFGKAFAWAGPRGLLGPGTRSIALYYGDEAGAATADLRSFAGFGVADDFEPGGDLEVIDIEAGPAAKLVFKGPYSELEGAYQYLFGVWLPESGWEPADRPAFEEYLNDPRQTPPPELLTAVYLPLQP